MREKTGEQAKQGTHPFFRRGASIWGRGAISVQPLSQKHQVAPVRFPDRGAVVSVQRDQATDLVQEEEKIFVLEKIFEMMMNRGAPCPSVWILAPAFPRPPGEGCNGEELSPGIVTSSVLSALVCTGRCMSLGGPPPGTRLFDLPGGAEPTG